MTTQNITHHGFRYYAEVKSKEESEESKARQNNFVDWLFLFLVAGLTVFLVISFSIL